MMCLGSRLEVKWQIYSRGSLILEKRCVKARAHARCYCWCAALVNFVLPTPQPTRPQRTLVHHHGKKTGFLNEKGHHAKSSLEENLHTKRTKNQVLGPTIITWTRVARNIKQTKRKKSVHIQTTAAVVKSHGLHKCVSKVKS